jgi:SAM-dependent methyltransferase
MVDKKKFNFSAKYYDFIYKKKNYLRETNFICKFLPKKKKSQILDLGTGTGSHLINLIKKGHAVDGVEISSNMLKIAKRKIAKNNIKKNFNLYKKDLIKFKGRKNNYDAIISLFHVINYLKNINSLKKFFLNSHKGLKRDGILLFDCWNEQIIKKNKLTNSKKTILLNGYKIVRHGNIKIKNRKKIEVLYEFRIYQKDKLISKFFEEHILHSFSKAEILEASKGKFLLTNNCLWFNKRKSPGEKDFSTLFIFKKIIS